jgi:hypothetical protein
VCVSVVEDIVHLLPPPPSPPTQPSTHRLALAFPSTHLLTTATSVAAAQQPCDI